MASNPKKVKLTLNDHYAVLDNGIMKLTLLNPDGAVTGIEYGGTNNLMEIKSKESSRGYWDLNWSVPGGKDTYELIVGTEFSVVQSSDQQIEVSFRRNWNHTLNYAIAPVNIDIRYIVRSGSSGFYTYAIYERPSGWPGFDLIQTRIAFRLRQDRFHFMAISDQKQRIMPMPQDRLPNRAKQLAYPEAVELINPINPDLKGEVRVHPFKT